MRKVYPLILFLFIFCFYGFNSKAQFPVNVAVTNCTCMFAQNGTATATPLGGTGPYQYAIDGGAFQVSNIFTNLPGGNHNIIVIDAVSNYGDTTFAIYEGPILNAAVTTTLTACHSGSGGTITVTPTNGNGPYTFTLYGYGTFTITGATQATFTQDIYASTYDIEITDADGCLGSTTAEVLNGDSLRGTGFAIAPSCSGAADGLIRFEFTNGVPPYNLGDPTYTSPPLIGVYSSGPNNWYGDFAAGSYSWFVQDSIGCEGLLSMVVPAGIPAVTHAGNDTTVCSGASIQLSGSHNGMIGGGFEWTPATGLSNPDFSNPVATPSVTTTYVLTTSMQYNVGPAYCISSDSITITVISLDVPVVVNNVPVLSVSNPQSGASYTWQQLNGSTWDDIGTGTSYTVTANHEYRVKVSSGSCEMYSASQTAGRMAGNNPFNIALFPNPTANMLNLYDLKAEYNWQTLDIINAQGLRVMPTASIRNKTTYSANISRLNSGIYIVKCTKADGVTAEIRFIKN